MSIIGSLPYTLVNGQTADATQVMANFNTIVSNVNSSAAAAGANSDITSLSGLTTPLSVGQGGTGATTLAGAGIVTGPASATVGQIPGFSTTSGKVLAATYTVGVLENNIPQLGAGGTLATAIVLNASSLGAGTVPRARMPSGSVAQIVSTLTGAVATGSAVFVFDDTIPQISEGTQFMSRTITPTNALSTLEISVVFNGSINNGGAGIKFGVALFKDADADALAATTMPTAASNIVLPVAFSYTMVAGTTSTLTFSVRAGPGSDTLTFNGGNGSRQFGGAMISSIIIKEYLP